MSQCWSIFFWKWLYKF